VGHFLSSSQRFILLQRANRCPITWKIGQSKGIGVAGSNFSVLSPAITLGMKQLPHLCPFRRAREVCSCFQTPFLFNLPTLAVLPPTFTMTSASKRPLKRHHRTATTVLAGNFDPWTTSDASTRLLNGISPCKAVDEDKETKRIERREKREHGRERLRLKRKAEVESNSSHVTLAPTTTDKNN
jgi:hypothetical protein